VGEGLECRPTPKDERVELAIQNAISIYVAFRGIEFEVPPKFVVFVKENPPDVVPCGVPWVEGLIGKYFDNLLIKMNLTI